MFTTVLLRLLSHWNSHLGSGPRLNLQGKVAVSPSFATIFSGDAKKLAAMGKKKMHYCLLIFMLV